MGGRVLLMGFHPMDETYMTCYEQYNFLGETIYPEAVASKDYLEIANTFIERLQMQLEKVKEFRAAPCFRQVVYGQAPITFYCRINFVTCQYNSFQGYARYIWCPRTVYGVQRGA